MLTAMQAVQLHRDAEIMATLGSVLSRHAPGAPASKGKAAINTYFAKDTAESAKAGVTFSIDPTSDVGIARDVAWESGTYAVKAKSGASVEVGKFLTVYKKSGGKWLIIRDIWNSDAPPAPAAPAPATPAPAPPAKK